MRAGDATPTLALMEADSFDEAEFFRAIAASEARVLLIGRRALIALGVPVLTADYDFWLHADDAAVLNGALAALDMIPSRTPEEARRLGRYVIENGEHVDVIVARQVSTQDGVPVRFDDVYGRAELVEVAPGATVRVPSLPDLILTKQFGARPKDVADLDLLKALLAHRKGH